MKNNIAAIGITDKIKLLHFCGIEKIFLTDNEKKIEKIIDDLAEKEFAIILVEEEILKKIPKIVLKYKNKKTPAITSIPSISDDKKYNFKNTVLYENIKKIVGEDLNIKN